MDGLTTLQTPQKGYCARLFGSFLLLDALGNDCTPRNRKTRGLAAYLVVTQGALVTRDRLAGLLWGDRGEEQARASLRQALYELRALATGERPLLHVERGDIQLFSDNIDTDLDRLRQLTSDGDAAALCVLLGERPGDFLSGFDDLAEGFDEWLAGERVRRTEERHGAVLTVTSKSLAAGDIAHASRLASALLAIEPYNEGAARLAMSARQGMGDRDGIRRIFARYAETLKEEFGVSPPAEMTALLAELVASTMTGRQNPQLQASARTPQLDYSVDKKSAGNETARPTLAPPKQRVKLVSHPRLVLAAGAVLSLIAAIGLGFWLTRTPSDNARVIMVEPFVTAPGDAQARSVGQGLASDISRMIVGNDHGLAIADPEDASATGKHADFVVSGDAETSGGVIHAGIRLLDHANGSILWSRSFSRPIAEVDGLRDQIATHLGDVAVCALGGHNPSLAQLGVEVTRYYLQACEDKHGDFADSAKLLTLIVQQRPNFAHAWAMLAAATGVLGLGLPDNAAKNQFELAAKYAHRALSLDPHDGEAYLGLVYRERAWEDWPQRYELLMKGHAADPENAVLNIILADVLAPVGRPIEGQRFAQRAVELDPFNPWAAERLMSYTGYEGDPDSAQALYTAASRRWPDDADLERSAFDIMARVGDPALALSKFNPHAPPNMTPERASIWRAFLNARRTGSSADVDQLTHLLNAGNAPQSSDTLVVNAVFYVILGKIDLAFSQLDRLEKAPLDHSELLFWDYAAPLHADPRFIEIANRVGLVSIWRRTKHWPDFCANPKLPYNCRQIADKLKN